MLMMQITDQIKQNKREVFKSNATFTENIRKINNTQIHKCCDANV